MAEPENLQNMLENFQKIILDAYELNRIDKQFATYIHEVSEPATHLPKGSGPIEAKILKEGEALPPPYILSTQPVTPINIGFSVNLPEFFLTPGQQYKIDFVLSDIGRELAQREATVIVKNIINNAGRSIEVKEKGKLSRNDLVEAEMWIKTQGFYVDTIILHPKQEAELIYNGQIIEASRFPEDFLAKKGSHFSGMFSGLNVYWAPIFENVVAVYKKSEIIVLKTPLTLRFDNDDYPRKLILEQFCSSAPVDERGVVIINL